MNPTCPFCGSKHIGETDRFDMTYIEPAECGHDFECDDCGGLFQILYAPFEVRKVAGAKPGEVEAAEKMVRDYLRPRSGEQDVKIDFDSPSWSAMVTVTRYTGKKRFTPHAETLMAEGDTPTEAAEKLIAEYEAFQARERSR